MSFQKKSFIKHKEPEDGPLFLKLKKTEPSSPVSSKSPEPPLPPLSSKPESPYPVGYAQPPKHTQFPKGVSGNPGGRPKGSRYLNVILSEELDQSIIITEGGKTLEMTKQEVFVKSLINKAASGHPKAQELLFKEMRRAEETAAAESKQPKIAVLDLSSLDI